MIWSKELIGYKQWLQKLQAKCERGTKDYQVNSKCDTNISAGTCSLVPFNQLQGDYLSGPWYKQTMFFHGMIDVIN